MAFPWAKEHENLALTFIDFGIKEVIFFIKQCNSSIDWVITMSCRSFQKELKLISYSVTWECCFCLSWSSHWHLCIWGWYSSGCCGFTITIQRWHL